MKDVFMNTRITAGDLEMLDKLMIDDDFDRNRSAYVRRLIRQEWRRRYQAVSLVNNPADSAAGQDLISSR